MSRSAPILGVVLAAGRGARLGSLTTARSKAMLPVAGVPMIGRVMAMLSDGGCDHLIVVVHPSDHELEDYLASGPWAPRVQTVAQEQRRGMAHALQCAERQIRANGATEFALASCDNIYPVGHVASLVALRRHTDLDASITLLRVPPSQIPTLAVVEMRDGLVQSIVEKPRPEDAPSDLGVPSLHALSDRILEYLPQVPVSSRGEREFPDALGLMIDAGGRVGGQLVQSRFTLTRPRDLLALTNHFLRHDPESALVDADLPEGTEIVPPVRIEAGAALGRECRIGPRSVLEAGCRVGDRSTVKDSVVLRGAAVEPGSFVSGSVVV